MLSDTELMHIYDIGFRDDAPTYEAELAGLRAVAEAAEKQALEDAAEHLLSVPTFAHPVTEGVVPISGWLRARAASISTDKAGEGE